MGDSIAGASLAEESCQLASCVCFRQTAEQGRYGSEMAAFFTFMQEKLAAIPLREHFVKQEEEKSTYWRLTLSEVRTMT